VARQLGGTPVPEETRDPQLRRLRNVVEEMAIASGVPVPRSTCWTGRGHQRLRRRLAQRCRGRGDARLRSNGFDRDELQGVIAHEFSHVFHGDMRLNIRLMGVLFGILMLGDHRAQGAGARLAAGAVPRRRRGILLMALAVMIVGYVGLFFGRMIKAGVSRASANTWPTPRRCSSRARPRASPVR
jgi:hypothetical protein